MSNYVMSDIHGCYYEFIDMLKLINFNAKDTLYILGDILDRGPSPLKLLYYIRKHKNIILLKGNHELLFEEAIKNKDYMPWYCNGGYVTHTQFLQYEDIEQKEIYNYVKNLPLVQVVNKYILVHAGFKFPENYNSLSLEKFVAQSEHTCVWNRENINKEKQFKDYTIICGHTPVQNIVKDSSYNKILTRKGTIYIDCGCCFKEVNGKLSCLRLDDLKEFYI